MTLNLKNKKDLIQAYRTMHLIRIFEYELNDCFAKGIVAGTTHLCIGQEACAVGICAALTPDDALFSNHRGHGHMLARGADPVKVMAEIFGSELGYSQGLGGSQHIAIKEINFLGTHGITGGTIPLAAGISLAKKMRKEPGISVSFFGDGAINQGVFHETANMASIWKLPVLFACENNLYAMSTPSEDMVAVKNIADRADAYNMLKIVVDGNHLFEVYEATQKAKKYMTDGNGPVFIELKTYRTLGHSRGDPRVYRSKNEEEQWGKKDCISLVYNMLKNDFSWSEKEDKNLLAETASIITKARITAMESL